eukprot:Pgem_evm1s9493
MSVQYEKKTPASYHRLHIQREYHNIYKNNEGNDNQRKFYLFKENDTIFTRTPGGGGG